MKKFVFVALCLCLLLVLCAPACAELVVEKEPTGENEVVIDFGLLDDDVATDPSAPGDGEEGGFPLWAIALIIVAVLLGAITTYYFLSRKKAQQ